MQVVRILSCAVSSPIPTSQVEGLVCFSYRVRFLVVRYSGRDSTEIFSAVLENVVSISFWMVSGSSVVSKKLPEVKIFTTFSSLYRLSALWSCDCSCDC